MLLYILRIYLLNRQVQKLDRINSDRQSGSDKLRSTRVEEKNIKLNEIETFTHLKVEIPVKNELNEERLAMFLRIVLCSLV